MIERALMDGIETSVRASRSTMSPIAQKYFLPIEQEVQKRLRIPESTREVVLETISEWLKENDSYQVRLKLSPILEAIYAERTLLAPHTHILRTFAALRKTDRLGMILNTKQEIKDVELKLDFCLKRVPHQVIDPINDLTADEILTSDLRDRIDNLSCNE